MTTLILQSYRDHDVPPWIARCLESVRAWARARGYDYRLTSDEAFALCGEEYLARVGGNKRAITNLCRLELIREAHAAGHGRAAWLDADVLVFDPDGFSLDAPARYAFARETWVECRGPGRWRAFAAVNNSVTVFARGEPDLDLLIGLIRHIARHRTIASNYQMGGDLIKGLRASLAFEVLDDVGMLSHFVVKALAAGHEPLLAHQARLHGTPIRAANLCATANYVPAVSEPQVQRAIDRLLETKGEVINRFLSSAAPGFGKRERPALQIGREVEFGGPEPARLEA